MELAEIPEQVMSRRLGAGERLLWAGRPRQGIFFRPQDALTVPFGLLWTGFAIHWEQGAVTGRLPLFPRVFGMVFVLVGLYAVAGRFVVDAYQRSRTYYGLTDRRVIIVRGLPANTVNSFHLRALSDISMTERTDGRGTITFGPGAYRPSTQWFAMSEDGSTCFDSISAVREVYDRIRVAQKADPGASQVDPAPSPSRSFPGARVPPEDVVSEQLGSGERLLWAGRPKQGFLLRVGDLIAIPFSIAWAGVCLLMMVSRGPDDPLPIVVVVPFAAIGIYMLVGRFVVDIWLRAHTTYGLTNRRVVIIVEGFRRQIKSLSLQTLADVALSESPDGSGTITFGSVPSPMWYPEVNVPGFAGPQMPRFERIANSRIVYGQIRAAQS